MVTVMMIMQGALAFMGYQELSMVLNMCGVPSSQQPGRVDRVNPSYICEDKFRERK